MSTIQSHLLKTNPNLTFVYQSQGAPATALATTKPPRMPKEMVPIERPASGVVPAEFALPSPGPVAELEQLSADERAALDEIHRRKAEGAEVICVIRSRSNPSSPSEILVLDHASPAFLNQLAAESRGLSTQQVSVLEAVGGQAKLPRPLDQQTTSVRGTPGLPLYSSHRTLPAAGPSHSDWEPRWLEPSVAGR